MSVSPTELSTTQQSKSDKIPLL